MRILIIGAGFIGNNLAEGFEESSYEVSIIDKLKIDPISNYRIYQRDVESNIDDIFNQVKPEVVYYLINDDKVNKSNGFYHNKMGSVSTFINVLNACIKYHTKKVILCSNLSISHNDCEGCIATKKYVLPDLQQNNIQMFTKELYLSNLKKHYNIEFVSLRLPVIYGYRKNIYWANNVINELLARAVSNKVIKVSKHAEDFINLLYIGDAISALIYALKMDVTGIFNVVGYNHNFIEIAEEIQKHNNIKIKFTNDIDMFQQKTYTSNSLEEYGWKPIVSLATGVKVTYKHIKNMI